jgi:hypothetical protein
MYAIKKLWGVGMKQKSLIFTLLISLLVVPSKSIAEPISSILIPIAIGMGKMAAVKVNNYIKNKRLVDDIYKGNLDKQQYEWRKMDHFRRVSFKGVGNVVFVKKSETKNPFVAIHASKDFLGSVKTVVEGGTLKISLEGVTEKSLPYPYLNEQNEEVRAQHLRKYDLTVVIFHDALDEISCNGVVNAIAKTPISSTNDLKVDLKGTSHFLAYNLKGSKVSLNVSGTAHVKVRNLSAQKDAVLASAGDVNASIKGINAARVGVKAERKLKVKLVGKSKALILEHDGRCLCKADKFETDIAHVTSNGSNKTTINLGKIGRLVVRGNSHGEVFYKKAGQKDVQGDVKVRPAGLLNKIKPRI